MVNAVGNQIFMKNYNFNSPLKLMLTIAILLLFACNFNSKKTNTIEKVILGTGYCHGDCVFQAIEIDNNLKYKYYGGKNAEKKGYFIAKADKKLWDELEIMFNKIKINDLDTLYDRTYDDQSFELIIYANGKRKHIKAQYESLQKELKDIVDFLSGSYKNVDLQPIDYVIDFESKIQKEQIPDSVPKFPPPSRNME